MEPTRRVVRVTLQRALVVRQRLAHTVRPLVRKALMMKIKRIVWVERDRDVVILQSGAVVLLRKIRVPPVEEDGRSVVVDLDRTSEISDRVFVLVHVIRRQAPIIDVLWVV